MGPGVRQAQVVCRSKDTRHCGHPFQLRGCAGAGPLLLPGLAREGPFPGPRPAICPAALPRPALQLPCPQVAQLASASVVMAPADPCRYAPR